MGSQFKALCKSCQRKFRVEQGGGMRYEILHCSDCGRSKDFPLLRELIPVSVIKTQDALDWVDEYRCKCGGEYGDYPVRCPKCKSLEWQVDGDVLCVD